MNAGDRFMTLKEVEKKVGLKKSAIYARAATGEFPQAVKIGAATRWSEAELDEWIDRQKQARVAA
jgi:prophage regulatory protein